MKLNYVQRLVAKHYEGGDFCDCTDDEDVERYGDTLFEFLIREADDAESIQEYRKRIAVATAQLALLANDLDQE